MLGNTQEKEDRVKELEAKVEEERQKVEKIKTDREGDAEQRGKLIEELNE